MSPGTLKIILIGSVALNLFAVGMPVAMMAGLILLAMAVPIMAEGITASIKAGLEQARMIAEGQ